MISVQIAVHVHADGWHTKIIFMGRTCIIHMKQVHKDLSEVGRLPRNLILKITDLVDEDIIVKQNIPGLKDILGDVDADVDMIEQVFYNILIFKNEPKKFTKLIDDTTALTDEQKDTLKEAMKKVHDKVDIDKISVNRQVDRLETFGHLYAHIDDFSIATEFRPILDKDTKKIIKIVPSLVIDNSHQMHTKDNPINFQMDLKNAQQFVDSLNRNINTLKVEIQELREKFGSDVT